MSIMVVDALNFALGTKTYEFCEEGTFVDQTVKTGQELSQFLAEKAVTRKFEKLILVGPTIFTSELKNQVSSQLQLNQSNINPIEIELKEKWEK